MIDPAEVDRRRRKWLVMACVFPAVWFIHPLVLASAFPLYLGVVLRFV